MEPDKAHLNYISDVTESIYTFSITAKENKFRTNMKRLRELFHNNEIDASAQSQEIISNCLWFAVLDREISSVRELMCYKSDANFVRSDINMLWMALIRGDLEIARLLVENGADVNVRIPEGGPSFLHFLATMSDDYHSFELAKIMIVEKGADVNACVDGCSVLQTAVIHRSVQIVELLLTNGAQFRGIGIIILAAENEKSSELLPLLIHSIDDVNIKIAWIFASLQYLIEKDGTNLKEIKALLDLELPVLHFENEGWTVLRFAVYFGKTEVMELLLKYGADLNRKAEKGNFPLLWATSMKDTALLRFLVDNGADVNQCNDFGRCALHAACQYGPSENIDILLRAGANVNMVDGHGFTPFCLLTHDRTMGKSLKLMIKHMASLGINGINVNKADLDKIEECPVMMAYYEECLSEFVEK